MKLKFDEEQFISELEDSIYDAMIYFQYESLPWVPYDTGNLYESFTIELERTKKSIIATGRWHGFRDKEGNILRGETSGYFNYGQYQWDNHQTKFAWGETALAALIDFMKVIIKEGME